MSKLRRAGTALAIVLVCGAAPGGVLQGQERAAPAKGLIVGKVVDSTGASVPGAHIRFSGPAGWMTRTDGSSFFRELITSPEGEFYFTDLPAGEYGIRAEKQGYQEGFYGRQRPEGPFGVLTLGESERRVDVRITMWKHAVVTGTAIDESGMPLQGGMSLLRREVVAGRPTLKNASARGGLIDDRGHYRLYDVAPGTYVLRYGGWSDGRTYLPTCAPDPVAVTAGQEVQDVDVRVGPSSVVHVAGTVRGGGSGTRVQLVPASLGLPSPCDAQEYSASVHDGSFTFRSVRPGRYELQAAQEPPRPQPAEPGPQTVIQTPAGTITGFSVARESSTPGISSEPALWGSIPVVVGPSDIDDITLTLQRGARVSGRLEFDIGSGPPSQDQIDRHAGFRFERADGEHSFVSHPQTKVSNGRIAISGVLPGRYVINGGSYGSWAIRSVTVGGRDVTGVPIEIGLSDLTDLVITFTDRMTTISGVASNAEGSADTTMQVLIFPSDARFWVDYGDGSPPPRMMRTGTAAGGAYSATVPPGDYRVVATSGDVRDDWTDPAYLKLLAAVADQISVNEGDKAALNLRSRTIP